jgi:hypothetical protein
MKTTNLSDDNMTVRDYWHEHQRLTIVNEYLRRLAEYEQLSRDDKFFSQKGSELNGRLLGLAFAIGTLGGDVPKHSK